MPITKKTPQRRSRCRPASTKGKRCGRRGCGCERCVLEAAESLVQLQQQAVAKEPAVPIDGTGKDFQQSTKQHREDPRYGQLLPGVWWKRDLDPEIPWYPHSKAEFQPSVEAARIRAIEDFIRNLGLDPDDENLRLRPRGLRFETGSGATGLEK